MRLKGHALLLLMGQSVRTLLVLMQATTGGSHGLGISDMKVARSVHAWMVCAVARVNVTQFFVVQAAARSFLLLLRRSHCRVAICGRGLALRQNGFGLQQQMAGTRYGMVTCMTWRRGSGRHACIQGVCMHADSALLG